MTTLPFRRRRGLGVRATLNRHRPLRNLPHPAAARALALLYALDRAGHPQPTADTVQFLRDLAQVPWLEPLVPDLVPPSDLRALVSRLLVRVRYPLPAWLWSRALPPWPVHASVLPELTLLAHLGRGGDLRDGPGLPALTRREAHALFLDGEGATLWEAARRAQLRVAGAAPDLVDAVVSSRLVHIRDAHRWEVVVRWMLEIELPARQVAEVGEWLEEPGADRDVPDKWTHDRVDTEIDQWILDRFRSGELPEDLPLPCENLLAEPVLDGGWTLRQLANWRDFCEEGEAMEHCVADYASDALRRRGTYWSMRRYGERCLTVEVVDGCVVTALGLQNRDPTSEENEALEKIAVRLGWSPDY